MLIIKYRTPLTLLILISISITVSMELMLSLQATSSFRLTCLIRCH